MIEDAIAATPDAIAVISGREHLSYSALDERAGSLAVRLRCSGVGAESIVGLMIDRSVDLIVAILATFRAGGAFLPLDPALPVARLTAMVEDAAPTVILAGAAYRPLAQSLGNALDPRRSIDRTAETVDLPVRHHPLGLAYVLFTSGTTGRPKGVGNTHEALANRIDWMQRAYGAGTRDRILQKTPTSFDVSVWELLWPLTVGGCVVMARPDGHRDLPYLHRIIRVAAITRLHFVPSMLDAFLSDGVERSLPSLRQIVVSGEALTPALAKRLSKALPHASLDNLYGPTEAAIDVTAHHVVADDDPMPIGREIDNIVMRVVDRRMAPQRDGEQGELGITGIGLARGYLSRPDLTAASFVPDRLGTTAGSRMYRTGDLGLRRDDGTLLYRGRRDHQVKLNGQRIELLEVEAAIGDCMGGVACAASVETFGRGQVLVAYVVANDMVAQPAHDAWTGSRDTAVRMVPASAVARLEADLRSTGRPTVECDGRTTALEALITLPRGRTRVVALSGIVHRFPAVDALEEVLVAAHAALMAGGKLQIDDIIDPLVLDKDLAETDLGKLARLSIREPGLLVSPGWISAWATSRGGTVTIDRESASVERYHATIDFSGHRTAGSEGLRITTWPAWAMVNARLSATLADRLVGVLPMHMHPAACIALSSMPVTANGKANRACLPRLADMREVAPQDWVSVDTTPLARWWEDVLGQAPAHADEDFFFVGGDSIQAIRLSARAHAAGWMLSPADIHRARTISAMSTQLRRLDRPSVQSRPVDSASITLPPFIDGMVRESLLWPKAGINIEQMTFDVEAVDREIWQRAWDTMINAHVMFHAYFKADRAGFRLESGKGCSLPIEWCDLSDVPEALREDRWRQWLESDAVIPFKLVEPPIMRMRMVRWDKQRWRGVWTLHHALTDGWSYAVALEDVRTAYLAIERNQAPKSDVSTDFGDWCVWRAEHAPTVDDARFWRRYLATVASSGTRAFTPAVEVPQIVMVNDELDRAEWQALQDAARTSGVGAFVLIQAIWDDAVRSVWPNARMGALHAVRPSTLVGMERIVGPLFTVLPVAKPRPGSLSDRVSQFAYDVAAKHDRLAADPVYLSSIDRDGGAFDAIMVYENTPAIATEGWLRNVRVKSRFNQPLVVLIWPRTDGLAIDLYIDEMRVLPTDAARLRDRFLVGLREGPGQLLRGVSKGEAAENANEDIVDISL